MLQPNRSMRFWPLLAAALATTVCGTTNSSAPSAPVSTALKLFTADATFDPPAGSTLTRGSPFSVTLNFPRHTDAVAAFAGVAFVRDDGSATSGGCIGGDARVGIVGEALPLNVTFRGVV